MLSHAGCHIVNAAAAYFHHVKYAPNACIAGALRCGVTFAEFVFINVQDGPTGLQIGV